MTSQARTMTICEGPDTIPQEVGLWYSKDSVDALIAAEREACAKVCEEHAADRNPPYKPHEDNYLDGWQDASNECTWAIRARSNTP